MFRHSLKVGVAAGLIAAFGLPASLSAQECAKSGNKHTRGADVELSYAARRDDPQPKEDRYARTIRTLEPALSDDEPLPRAYLLAGTAYLGLRDYGGADSMLTKLISVEPGCADLANEMRFNAWVPLYNRGINSLRAGDQDAALEAFLQANVIYSDSRSLTNAANIYQQRGDNATAMQMYERALAVGGEPDMVRAASINMAELLRMDGRNDEALAIYSEYASDNPDDVLGLLNYAVALMDSGDQEAAEQLFTELLVRDDLSFRQWSQVGIGLYRAQDFTQAAVAFERAHDMSPLNKETMENLANTYYQAERYDELVPVAGELVDRYPFESVNYNLLANAHRELQDADAALAVLERRDALEFEFLRSQLTSVSENVYSVEGQVMNKSATAGLEVTVPIDLLGEGGEIIASEELLITLPAAGEASSFLLQFQIEDAVSGFQYNQDGSSADS
ncbi:MAG: tetratricopeptide repeat protein [Gemmatimonadetes bacterium]|nr:tetratricopeptide repeat protein [Gemmatimonadota bacterium]